MRGRVSDANETQFLIPFLDWELDCIDAVAKIRQLSDEHIALQLPPRLPVGDIPGMPQFASRPPLRPAEFNILSAQKRDHSVSAQKIDGLEARLRAAGARKGAN
jgi:hypothetical protein